MSPPREIRPETGYALELLDAAMVFVPRGWRSVTLSFAWQPDGARLEGAAPTFDSLGPKDAVALGLRDDEARAVAAHAFVDLCQALGVRAEQVVIERTTDDDVRVMLAPGAGDGASVRTVTLDPSLLPLRIVTDAVHEAWDASRAEARARSAALAAATTGWDRWRFEPADGTLFLDRGNLPWRTLPAELLATWRKETEELTWAWAVPNARPENTASVRALRREAERMPGLGVFLRPVIPAASAFAETLCALAASSIEGAAVFAGTLPDGTVYFLVPDPRATAG